MSKPFQITLTPDFLFSPINPVAFLQPGATFGAISVNFGQTPRRDIETEILERVGSYGRQLGRIGDALEVLTRYLPREILDEEARAAIDALRDQVAEIRKVKQRMGAGVPANAG